MKKVLFFISLTLLILSIFLYDNFCKLMTVNGQPDFYLSDSDLLVTYDSRKTGGLQLYNSYYSLSEKRLLFRSWGVDSFVSSDMKYAMETREEENEIDFLSLEDKDIFFKYTEPYAFSEHNSFSPDSRYFTVLTADSKIRLYRRDDLSLVEEFYAEEAFFSSNGKNLILNTEANNDNGTVKLTTSDSDDAFYSTGDIGLEWDSEEGFTDGSACILDLEKKELVFCGQGSIVTFNDQYEFGIYASSDYRLINLNTGETGKTMKGFPHKISDNFRFILQEDREKETVYVRDLLKDKVIIEQPISFKYPSELMISESMSKLSVYDFTPESRYFVIIRNGTTEFYPLNDPEDPVFWEMRVSSVSPSGKKAVVKNTLYDFETRKPVGRIPGRHSHISSFLTENTVLANALFKPKVFYVDRVIRTQKYFEILMPVCLGLTIIFFFIMVIRKKK